MGKTPAPQRECAFCPSRPDSKEHVFGQWVAPVLGIDPKDVESFLSSSYRVDPDHLAMGVESVFRADVRQRSGNPSGRTERMVCQRCNNGWMSQLESRAALILTPLILGQTTDLSPDEQELLALWADKTAVVWEYADRKSVVSTEEHRYGMKASLKPMPTSLVWIGRFDNETGIKAPKIVDLYGFTPPHGLLLDRAWVLRENQRNHRFTAIALGRVCFYIQYGTTANALTCPSPMEDKSIWQRFERLNPPSGAPLKWPRDKGLTYLDIMDLVGQR